MAIGTGCEAIEFKWAGTPKILHLTSSHFLSRFHTSFLLEP